MYLISWRIPMAFQKKEDKDLKDAKKEAKKLNRLEKPKDLAALLAQVNKVCKDGDGDEEPVIKMLSDNSRTNVVPIPSGSLALDNALGIGGFPRGRIVEIYGPEASGKT